MMTVATETTTNNSEHLNLEVPVQIPSIGRDIVHSSGKLQDRFRQVVTQEHIIRKVPGRV